MDCLLGHLTSFRICSAPTTLGVISIFLRAITLQTDSPSESIGNPAFRVDSPTSGILVVLQTVGLTHSRTIDTVVKASVSHVLLFVGLLIH